MRTFATLVVVILSVTVALAQENAPLQLPARAEGVPATLDHALYAFYSGRYDDASTRAHALCVAGSDSLAACELHTSSLHFQIKLALGGARDREQAWRSCAVCPDLLSAFIAGVDHARALARTRLQQNPDDDAALFLLGKIDLNYVWLQLGTLGRRTGLKEYREARGSLDKVLERNPDHLRARVARAWIDYIVGTKMPRGTRWLLGGGSRTRGLQGVREAARQDGDFFDETEASFALWDMQVRERDLAGAVATAQELARDFPDNWELARFLAANRQLSQ